jgi:hypothetical protein
MGQMRFNWNVLWNWKNISSKAIIFPFNDFQFKFEFFKEDFEVNS